MRNFVIIHSRYTDTVKEYFFSTDHCQGVEGKKDGTYPEGFVPTTYYLPMTVVPRSSLPSGRVETIADVLTVFFYDAKEILNPLYQGKTK